MDLWSLACGVNVESVGEGKVQHRTCEMQAQVTCWQAIHITYKYRIKDILCARNKECHDGGSWAGERGEESRTATAVAYGCFVSHGFWTRQTGGSVEGQSLKFWNFLHFALFE